MSKRAILSAAFLITSSCTVIDHHPQHQTPLAGLAGTSWRLVEIQSMDDGAGTMRPRDRARYTVSFEADGSLRAQLDCNRGSGTWRSDTANGTDGTLAFGPMAVTRALCAEPTLGEMLERQFPYVRSFTIRDGQMSMALMADGGLIIWEPVNLNQ